jgi:hypothetical protein
MLPYFVVKRYEAYHDTMNKRNLFSDAKYKEWGGGGD